MADFEKLKGMRVDEIYNKTYLAHKNIEAILNKEFDKLNRFKIMGFIGILEKSYGFDLSKLKNEASEYYDKVEEVSKIEALKNQEAEPVKTYDKKIVGLFIGVVFVLILVILMSNDNSKEEKIDTTPKTEEVSQSVVLEALQNEALVVDEVLENSNINDEAEEDAHVQEISKTDEKPLVEVSATKVEQPLVIVEKQQEATKKTEDIKSSVAQKITITPTRQIWLGVIYLDDYSKKEYLTSSDIEIDSSKNQLILAGHGHLKVTVDGNEDISSDDNRIRFLLQNGELKMIKRQDFRDLNKGKDW